MPRIRRTFGKKTRKFDEQTFENDFRFPPKPDSYYDVKEKGQCRWCDGIINDEYGRRKMNSTWHPECSEEYLMYYNSKHIRKYIKQRDYCECAECGEYDPRFHIDHIRPLYEQKYKQPLKLIGRIGKKKTYKRYVVNVTRPRPKVIWRD